MESFKDSITIYKSIYLHFLDGLINTTSGSNFRDILFTLDLAGFYEENLKFAKLQYYNKFSIINFYNQNLNFDENLFVIDYTNDKIYHARDYNTETDKNYTDIPEDSLEQINWDYDHLSYFQFCIIPISFNKHQTTTIIFMHGDCMYLYILNTGLDMYFNGESTKINDNFIYKLTKGIQICNDIFDPDKVSTALEFIKNFFYISFFYNYIEKKNYLYCDADNLYYFFEENFIEKLKKFKLILGDTFNIKIFNYKGKKTIDEIICYVDESKTKKERFYDIINIYWDVNYYILISKFLDNFKEYKIGDIITNITNYDDKCIPKLKINENLKYDFLKKIILYNYDNNIYIYTQESGSCTWYSIYFSLLLFYAIKKENNYIKFINKININFSSYLLDLFSTKNFKYEFQKLRDIENIETYYYYYMLKLYSKFVDIQLFDNKLLYEQQDIKYNTILKLKIEQNIFMDDIYYYNFDNYYDYDENFNDIRDLNYRLLLNLNKSTSIKFNKFYLTAYYIYEKNNFFNPCIDANSIIKQLMIFLDIDESTPIINNIKNYLLLFENTYNIKYGMEKYPSYITFFIPIILYIDNNLNHELKLNFNDGKENLFNCCLVFFRFYLLIKIIELCNQYTTEDDDRYYTNLFKMTVIKLVDIKHPPELINLKLNKDFQFDFEMDDIFNFYKVNYYNNVKINQINFILDGFEEKFDILLDIEDFFLQNPVLITKEFLIYNLHRYTEDQRLSLIHFYSTLIYNCDDIHTYLNIFYILIFYADNSNLYFKQCTKEFYDFELNLINLKKESVNEKIFYDNIIKNKDNFYKDEFYIIPDYNFNDKKIKDTYYDKVEVSCSLFNKQVVLLKMMEENDDTFDIYRVIQKNYIQYICKLISKEDDMLDFKLVKIYFNGNEVLNYDSIIYPFKYIIPITDLYYIYQQDSMFNIAYDIQFKFDNTILGLINIKRKIYNFEINKNTQFFLNKFISDKDLNNWENLCSDLQLNSYNILYVNLNKKNTNSSGYSINNIRYPNIFNFDKHILFRKEIEYKLYDFKLLDVDSSYFVNFNIENSEDKEFSESYKKLLFKISNCNFNFSPKWIEKFKIIKSYLNCKIKNFTNYIKDINFSELLINKFEILQSYLLNIKISNFIEKLLENFHEEKFLCSIIKNYNFLFDTKKKSYNYLFEIIFELIYGNEILNEQMERYNVMIESFNNYNKPIIGGFIEDELKENLSSLIDVKNNFVYNQKNLSVCDGDYYQLHHFMMGKGKSTVITPLLSLYLNLIKNQYIYIIVPKHLEEQTKKILNDYLNIFQVHNIFIKSEDQIKKDFLDKNIYINKIHKNTVFLIDEFDSLINPYKSNFNLVEQKSIETNIISNVIKNIIINNKDNLNDINRDIILSYIPHIIKNKEFLADNLISIIHQLKNGQFKYNIHWGIDSENLYAIPFRNKDKPIKNSSFVSCIRTIFLTYYYYIILNDYKIDINLFNFYKKNKYLKKLIKIDENIINIQIINQNLEQNESLRNNFFIYSFTKILENIKLPEKHYNTSFIDIINIDYVFKIGYSGTVNITLPKLKNKYQFSENCLFNDEDESTNIEYAIKSSIIVSINLNLYELKDYDALIDVCGYYYNELNYNVAFNIYNKLKRNVIFINENDDKMIIKDGILLKLNENIKYEKPFFYYDQSHIIGIDIKQDNYPILHGLCIIDNISTYTEVAQAIFRLRKLNYGHYISFLLNKFNLNNTTELLCKLRYNEINFMKQQFDMLNLQALKSDIRKKDEFSINNYEEKIFYYFFDDVNQNPLNYIFLNTEDLEKINLEDYSLTQEKVKNIVFNLDFQITEMQYQVSNQENIQTQMQLETLTEITKQYNSSIERNITKILNILNEIKKYKFKNFEFIKNIDTQKKYEEYTIKLNDLISFLPNIFFINFESPKYCVNLYNKSFNIDIIFMYVHQVKKFILTPKYMLFYLYDDYIFYDLNFNIININKQNFHNADMINEMENNFFTKIITNNFTKDEFNTLKCYLDLINNGITKKVIRIYLLTIIYFYKNADMFNYYINELIPYLDSHIENIIKNLDLTKYNCLIRDFINLSTKNLENFKYKYLKYKKKYLNLKN